MGKRNRRKANNRWISLVALILFGALGYTEFLPRLLDEYRVEPHRDEPTSTYDADEPSSQSGPIAVYFSKVWQSVESNKANQWNIANQCALWISSAKASLDVCCHEIDNEVIIRAIIQAFQRGVRVRVVTEADYFDESGPVAFRNHGIEVISDHRSQLMHNKFIVIDNRVVWTGSFNFTENCANKNNNNGVVIHDPRVAANFAEKFRWFWEERKFGGRPNSRSRIPYPIVTLPRGEKVESYFSTHDQVDKQIIRAIKGARQSIKFLAFSFTHDSIADAMLDQARNGVQVLGVFESRQVSKHSEFDRMDRRPNVRVLLDANPFNLHHKVIVIDDQTVVTGSYNFSASATDGNDENVVIIHSPEVARHFNEEFGRVFGSAQTLAASENTHSNRR